MIDTPYNYIIGGIVLCIAEIFVPSFVLLPIGLGAIGAGIASFLSVGTVGCFIVWAAISSLFFIVVKKLNSKNDSNDFKTGIEALVGMEAKITEEINPLKETGKVKIYSDEWELIFENNLVIPVGDKVKITGHDGNKLKYTK